MFNENGNRDVVQFDDFHFLQLRDMIYFSNSLNEDESNVSAKLRIVQAVDKPSDYISSIHNSLVPRIAFLNSRFIVETIEVIYEVSVAQAQLSSTFIALSNASSLTTELNSQLQAQGLDTVLGITILQPTVVNPNGSPGSPTILRSTITIGMSETAWIGGGQSSFLTMIASEGNVNASDVNILKVTFFRNRAINPLDGRLIWSMPYRKPDNTLNFMKIGCPHVIGTENVDLTRNGRVAFIELEAVGIGPIGDLHLAGSDRTYFGRCQLDAGYLALTLNNDSIVGEYEFDNFVKPREMVIRLYDEKGEPLKTMGTHNSFLLELEGVGTYSGCR